MSAYNFFLEMFILDSQVCNCEVACLSCVLIGHFSPFNLGAVYHGDAICLWLQYTLHLHSFLVLSFSVPHTTLWCLHFLQEKLL